MPKVIAQVRGFFSAIDNKTKEKICLVVSNSGGNLICHESLNKKTTKGKITIFRNILTEIYRGRGHLKYERPFVNKEFYMFKFGDDQ